MKLNEALQKAVREFGVNILKEKRLAALLSDYRAFDDLREMREVMQAVPDDPHTKELCRLAADDGEPDYHQAADGLRNSLLKGHHFRKELADRATDGILFALGAGKTSGELPAEVTADAGTAKAAVPVSAAPAGADASEKGRSGKGGLLFWRIARLSLILPPLLLSPSFWGDFLAVLLWGAAFPVCWPLSRLFGENYFVPLRELKGYLSCTWAVKSSYAERLTAVLGDTEAMTRLGNRYCSGKGVRQDFDEAAKWYRKALWKGSAEARCGLGLMYLAGKGVARDAGKALKWLQESADLGFAGAMKSLGDMYAGGDEVPQDDEAAADWYRNAAEHGSAEAQYIMGEMYSEGKLVPRNDGVAAGWYRNAAEQGNADAEYILGGMYRDGIGGRKDPAEADRWYRRASRACRRDAESGNAAAQCVLGVMYENGLGVSRNFERAAEWYGKAAAQGYAEAQDRLDAMRDADKI